MHPDGPFFFGKELGWVDILIAPCKYDPLLFKLPVTSSLLFLFNHLQGPSALDLCLSITGASGHP